MNADVAKELLNELSASLEALETRNAALLQFLKDKGIVTDEQLAPYLDQAGNASSVRWVAAKVRLERVFGAAAREEEKALQRVNETEPKNDSKAEQQQETNRQFEDADKTAEPKAVAKENPQKTTETPDKSGKPLAQPKEGAA